MSRSRSTLSRTLSYFRNTLPPAIHRLSVASILVASIAFLISMTHLGLWSHYFTIVAWAVTLVYWAILAMRASHACAPELSSRRQPNRGMSLDSQVTVIRPSMPSTQPNHDVHASPPRHQPNPSISYPSYLTHLLNLIVAFLLAGGWSGGSWIAIAIGAQYKREGDDNAIVVMPVIEGVLGYIDALLLWAIFGLCLRARIRRKNSPILSEL